MRVLQLTAGTGNFYCGTCLRDHALTRALRALGHETTMVPLYLPVVLEEAEPSQRPLFGGINVYLQQKSALFRKTPRWFDRLLDAPGLLRWASDRSSMTSARDLGQITLSTLRGYEGRQRKELDKLTEALAAGPETDVVCLSNALLIGMARPIKQQLGVPVVCTLTGEDSFLDSLDQPYRDEAWQVLSRKCEDIDAFVPVSQYYGDVMAERLKLPEYKVHVVHNGIDLQGYEPSASPPDPPVLGYLARLCEAKGLVTLVDAYLILKESDQGRNLKLHIAGAMTSANEPFVNQLKKKLAGASVMSDVTITPNLDRDAKQSMLRSLTVFSVPATYGESFGLYVLEAMASGVPVVQPQHGAFGELLDATGGGILCKSDDPKALADAIKLLLVDDDQRRSLARQGRQNVLEKFSVQRMARQVADVFEGVLQPT